MSIHNQLNKIRRKVDLKLKSVATEVMTETKQKLRDATKELWYDSYDVKDYIRTYELLDAIDGNIVHNGLGNYSIEVFFNPERMSVHSESLRWGQHVGFGGEDFRAGLIASVIHGMGGANTNPRKGDSTNVIEVVQKEASKYANQVLKKYL